MGDGGGDNHPDHHDAACPRKITPGRVDGKYGDGEVWGFTFIAGPTGSGKSWEADRLVGHARRVVKWIPPTVQFQARGWPVFRQPGALRRFLAEHHKGSFQCIYSPIAAELEPHFEAVATMVCAVKDVVFVVDEVDMLCSSASLRPMYSRYWSLPENKHRMPALQHLLNRGRHDGVAMVMMSRVPAQVNRLLTGMCDEMRIFRQSEPSVVDYFAAKSESAARLIPTLKQWQYVLWQEGKTPVVAGGKR